MKKILIVIIMVLPFIMAVNINAADDNVLRIYNWEDYIDEGDDESQSLLDDWVDDYYERTGKKVEYVYDTFATNEIMMNTLKTGKTSYDLVCPSEYTIQKMIRENMLEKYDFSEEQYTSVDNFNEFGSKYLFNLFKEEGLAEYSVPYTWGTLGFIYNPEFVSEDDISSWDILWNPEYKNRATAKDSVRDTYIIGVYHTYYEEVMGYKKQYQNGELSMLEYNKKLTEVMNRTDDETLNLVEKDLIEMKKNLYGFEVDNGKNDIATGRIWINFAWSGDAVYALDTAEDESNVCLNYKIPEEGSNIWFDGWVMPKGANKSLAQDFVNYLCKPESAARNMNYIGYTSAIAGDAIWEQVLDWYGTDEANGEAVDLTYLFEGTLSPEYLTDGKAIIYVGERGRQFDAQFPTYEEIARCCIMADFGDRNDQVLVLWKNVKTGSYNPIFIVAMSVCVVGTIGGVVFVRSTKKSRRLKSRSK